MEAQLAVSDTEVAEDLAAVPLLAVAENGRLRARGRGTKIVAVPEVAIVEDLVAVSGTAVVQESAVVTVLAVVEATTSPCSRSSVTSTLACPHGGRKMGHNTKTI